MIRVLSLHQPWATLVALGEKKIETRGWSTDFRGRFAIHAAQTRKHLEIYSPRIQAALDRHKVTSLPLGGVICIVSLDQVQPTEYMAPKISQDELAFGDYTPGRFAFGLRLLRVFDEPIPMRGHQKWWNWDEKEVS